MRITIAQRIKAARAYERGALAEAAGCDALGDTERAAHYARLASLWTERIKELEKRRHAYLRDKK